MEKLKPVFKKDACRGCGLCVLSCPQKILALDTVNVNVRGYHPVAVLDSDACVGCMSCAHMCLSRAIRIYTEQKEQKEQNGQPDQHTEKITAVRMTTKAVSCL